nr:MAG TPA: hypothetical protein [Caudoviricetes sp.]
MFFIPIMRVHIIYHIRLFFVSKVVTPFFT